MLWLALAPPCDLIYTDKRRTAVNSCVEAGAETGATTRDENRRNSRDDASQDSDSSYDEVVGESVNAQDSVYDVIDDDDDVTADECHQCGVYDDLQRSTRVFASPQSPVYQQILSDAATSATDSNGIGQDEQRLYLQLIGDDYQLQPPRETTKTFRHKCHKHVAISSDDVARANTL